MMARPQEQRQRWTDQEDQKLFECKSNNPQLSWPAIAKQAELDRSGKSCRERWNNYLNPDVNTGNFSLEEDNDIIFFQSFYGNRWATIATHFPRRTDNAIKNRWHNHLKKNQSIPNPPSSTGYQPDATGLFHLNQNIPNASFIPTPDAVGRHFEDDETMDHSLWGNEDESFIEGLILSSPER